MEILHVSNLSFKYPGSDIPALRDVSFDVAPGEFITIFGPSGCGKTTLLRLIKKELAPYGEAMGEILYCGRPVQKLSAAESSEMGFVMQRPEGQIVTDTVWHELAFGLENLGLPSDVIRRRVAETAAYFGIEEWFNQKTAELSGGQKQILNLASVLSMQPRLLLLDEPSAQLDPIGSAELFSALRRLNSETGLTVIMAEHRLQDAFEISDRIILLEDGAVIASAPPAELLKTLKSGGLCEKFIPALPAPVRVFDALTDEGCEGYTCPVTVRDGRRFLASICTAPHERMAAAAESYTAGNAPGSAAAGVPATESGPADMREALADAFAAHSSGRAYEAYRPETKPASVSTQNGEAYEEAAGDAYCGRAGDVPALELYGVSFRYSRNGGDVLKGISFSAPAGRICCLLGGNGSGKSTLLSVSAGLLKPYEGRVKIFGKRLHEYKNGSLYRGTAAMLPQDALTVFTGDSIDEDISAHCRLTGMPEDEARRQMERIYTLMHIAHLKGRHPADLSGGEQQKCAIAKLLLSNPRLLLLDEPSKGMDAFAKAELADIFKALKSAGKTVLIVTHDVEFACDVADVCALLFDGGIASKGAPRQFFAGNHYYTTPANRMSRGILPDAVTVREVIELCRERTERR